MAGIIPPGTAVLWLGNDTFSERAIADKVSVFAMDLGGNLLVEVEETGMTGVAFDGTNLWFSAQSGVAPLVTELTKRNTDGTLIPGAIFSPRAFSRNGAEDLTFDTKRQLLWRIDHDPATLVQIDPTTGAFVQSFVLPAADLGVLKGGYGIAYDTVEDVLYVSFGRPDGDPLRNFMEGVVRIVNPNTAVPDPVDPVTGTIAITGVLFRTKAAAPEETSFATGGLAYQPGTGTLTGEGTLWVGDQFYVRHMSLSGDVIARVRNPHPDHFVDGLEFVSGTL
jgi:hypothetical protein